MPFYVPLGVRGLLFWIGTVVVDIVGGWVYWRASRRRPLSSLVLVVSEPVLEA